MKHNFLASPSLGMFDAKWTLSLFFYRAPASILPFMDEKLMVATEGLLKASLERLFRTLRSKRASKETRVKVILEFHFTNEAAVRSFLEDMGMVEE